MCVREREREREGVCVCERERESVCVCVCVCVCSFVCFIRVTDTSTEAFILRLYRQDNKVPFRSACV